MAYDILIVDDEKDICNLIVDILEDEGYECRVAHSGREAMAKVQERLPSLILQDIWLGESSFDGLKVLEQVKQINCDVPFIMMSGHGTIETAVNALKLGAYDFLEKPFNSTRLLILIEKAIENSRLVFENNHLKQTQAPLEDAMIGVSDSIKALQSTLKKIAPTNSRIILQGPHGVGKEKVARLIHNLSLRKEAPFVTLNCMGIEPEELEEQLFGRERYTVALTTKSSADYQSNQGQDASEGSFTPGLLEQAHNGTLYLNSINDMPEKTQALMVKALHSQKFKRLGGQTDISVDVRIISSTTVDLKTLVDHKCFREDLYFRLSVVPLYIPALKDRPEDIAMLAKHFLSRYQNADSQFLHFSTDAILALKAYSWPGNVRQLKNVVEMVSLNFLDSLDCEIKAVDLPSLTTNENGSNASYHETFTLDDYLALPLKQAREKFEREYLNSQLERFDNNVSKMSAFVGMERSALHRKIKSLEVNKDEDGEALDQVKMETLKTAS